MPSDRGEGGDGATTPEEEEKVNMSQMKMESEAAERERVLARMTIRTRTSSRRSVYASDIALGKRYVLSSH